MFGLWVLAVAMTPTADPQGRMLDSSAACIIRKDRKAAAKLAGVEPGSPDATTLIMASQRVMTACKVASVDEGRLIGAIAQRFVNEIAPSIGEGAAVQDETAVANRTFDSAPGGSMESIALKCIVALREKEAKMLLRARPGSAAEQTALAGLGPSLSACLPAGERIRWAPLDLRLNLARRLYASLGIEQLVLESGA